MRHWQTRGSALGPCAAIPGWFVVSELLIWPSADVPVIDDWTYAWSVRHLLATGRLEILPISAVYPASQIVWGALFSLPSGFSFVALRISTIVLAYIGALALYLTLSELGFERRRALLGTFAVVCNPVSIVLTNSFMTDVPLVSLSCCAAYAYVRGFTRRSQRAFWIAAALSVAAVLVRQVAIVLPFAAAAVVLVSRDPELRARALAPALGGCVLVVVAWAGAGLVLGPSTQQSYRLNRLQYALSVGLDGYAWLTVEMALTLTFMLFPLVVALTLKRRFAWLLAVAAVGCVAMWVLGSLRTPFDPLDPDRATLSLYELGSARNLIAGTPEPPAYWASLASGARVALFLGVSAAVLAVVTAPRRGLRVFFARPAFRFFLVLALLHCLLIGTLWLYNDRYYLALIPALVVCLLGVVRPVRLGLPLAIAILLVQAGIGIVGTRDALRYNERCAQSYAALLRSGVRPYDIDGGWSWNGWMLYANAHNLPPDRDRERDVQAVTSKRQSPYLLAKARVAGYEPIQHVRWKPAVWPWPSEIYVLKRAGGMP